MRDFCQDRRGSLVVGRYQSEVQRIDFASITRGSPLCPVLYVFYNANLVEATISSKSGAIGFADDLNAWVTGPSPATKVETIPHEILPRVEQWADSSGAIFGADNTGFIHFRPRRAKTYEQDKREHPIYFQGAEIRPQNQVHILGVTLDTRFNMDAYVAKAAAKATGTCLSSNSLKGIRPRQRRQLYLACVTSVIDYDSRVGPVRLRNRDRDH